MFNFINYIMCRCVSKKDKAIIVLNKKSIE